MCAMLQRILFSWVQLVKIEKNLKGQGLQTDQALVGYEAMTCLWDMGGNPASPSPPPPSRQEEKIVTVWEIGERDRETDRQAEIETERQKYISVNFTYIFRKK